MPVLTLPGTDLLARWSALQADGVTASAAITLAQDNAAATPSGDARSVRIACAAGSATHIARCRIMPAQNLDSFDELRLVLRSDRAATGAPFYVELRLGSAALPIGAPANTWLRRLPLTGDNRWDLVRLTLDDLPAAVRAALTRMELQVLDATRPFTLQVDEALAVQPRMVADAEAALVARLHQRFVLGAAAVPARTIPAGGALPVQRPLIAILPLALRQAQERSTGQAQRSDHVTDGYRLRPAPLAWELGYAFEALAATRDEQAAIVDWLIGELPAQGSLRVGGQSLSLELVPPPPPDRDLIAVQVPRQWLACRAWAWQETGAALPVRPAETVVTRIDWKEPGHA
jgi:hypothetical protein